MVLSETGCSMFHPNFSGSCAGTKFIHRSDRSGWNANIPTMLKGSSAADEVPRQELLRAPQGFPEQGIGFVEMGLDERLHLAGTGSQGMLDTLGCTFDTTHSSSCLVGIVYLHPQIFQEFLSEGSGTKGRSTSSASSPSEWSTTCRHIDPNAWSCERSTFGLPWPTPCPPTG